MKGPKALRGRDLVESARRRNRLLGVAAVMAVILLATVCLSTQATTSTQAAYTSKITNTLDNAATASFFKCTDAVAQDDSTTATYFAYKLSDAGTTAADFSPVGANGTYQGTKGTSTATPIACSRDGGAAYVLNGTNAFITTPTQVTNPQVFSIEVWFKTTVAGGKLIGFGNQQSTSSGSYDRHLYIGSDGKVYFGVYNSGVKSAASPLTYTDGNWHQAVATMSAAGMVLYMDGVQVATNTNTVAETNTGYWRIGWDNLGGWTATPSNYYFTGSMRYASAWKIALTAAQVKQHWAAGQ